MTAFLLPKMACKNKLKNAHENNKNIAREQNQQIFNKDSNTKAIQNSSIVKVFTKRTLKR